MVRHTTIASLFPSRRSSDLVMDSAEQAGVVAELRALRAFYYYQLMDLFGGVPIVTTTEIKPRARNTRAEVFQFIESELLARSEEHTSELQSRLHLVCRLLLE